MKRINLVLASVTVVLAFGCNGNIEHSAIDAPDSLLLEIQKQETDESVKYGMTAGAPSSEKLWNDWFKACAKSDDFTKKGLIVFGPKGNKRLGFLFGTNKDNYYDDFYKIVGDTTGFSDIIDISAEVETCELSSIKSFSMDIFVKGNFFEFVQAKLGFDLSRARDFRIVSGKWRVDALLLNPFFRFVDKSSKQSIKEYAAELYRDDRLFLYKIVHVWGFNATYNTRSKYGPDIEARLSGEGLGIQIQDSTAENPLGFRLKFQRQDSTTLVIKSTGDFVPIGQLKKAVELK